MLAMAQQCGFAAILDDDSRKELEEFSDQPSGLVIVIDANNPTRVAALVANASGTECFEIFIQSRTVGAEHQCTRARLMHEYAILDSEQGEPRLRCEAELFAGMLPIPPPLSAIGSHEVVDIADDDLEINFVSKDRHRTRH